MPDDRFAEAAVAFVNEKWPYLSGLVNWPDYLRKFTLEVPETGSVHHPAIYEIASSTWKTMVAGAEKRLPHDSPQRQFARAYCLTYPARAVLLFPDDATQRPHISLFAPQADNDDKNLLIFYSVRLLIDPQSSVTRYSGLDRSDCTLSVSGVYPNRVFSCVRTGCQNECHSLHYVEENRVMTLSCSCP